jgi:hypothetical protein
MDKEKFLCLETIGSCKEGLIYEFLLNKDLTEKNNKNIFSRINSNDLTVFSSYDENGKLLINIGKKLLNNNLYFKKIHNG